MTIATNKRRFRVIFKWVKTYDFGIIEAGSKPKAKEYAEERLYDEMIDNKESEDFIITEMASKPKKRRR